MKTRSIPNAFIWLFWAFTYLFAQGNSIQPVTPNASPQAVELLNYLYSISGKYTLAGQHCAPLLGSTRLPALQRHTKKYPALFGQDFGFSYPGDWDGINFRDEIEPAMAVTSGCHCLVFETAQICGGPGIMASLSRDERQLVLVGTEKRRGWL